MKEVKEVKEESFVTHSPATNQRSCLSTPPLSLSLSPSLPGQGGHKSSLRLCR